MSVTAIGFVLLYFTGLILTFRNPYFGIATYIFEWHNHPPYMWWGDALPDLRWSLLVSVVTLISLIVNYGKLARLRSPKYGLIWWLVAMTAWMYFISAFYAIDPVESYKKSEIFFKMTIQIFFMMFIVRSLKQHRIVIWVMLLGVSNFGRIAYQSGSNRDLGVIAPNSTEENAISAHVAAITGFFGLYFLIGKKWEKIITALSVPFLINLIILANSRASFLALIVIAVLTFIWVKGRLRWQVLLGALAGMFLVFLLANESFWERQSGIREYEDDGSAMSRFYLWNGALRMFADYPMGLGGDGFQLLVIDYVPELAAKMEDEGAKTVHNTFLLVLVEWGFIGIVIFIGFLIHALLILARIRRDAKRSPGYRYYVDAMAIQMGLLGILTAGIFHNRLYSEVLYWFAAFGVALRNIQVTQIREQQDEFVNNETSEIPDVQTAQ